METRVRPRRWGTNGKRATSRLVYQRYAALKRISPRTAEDYYSGRCGPLADVLTMASVAATAGRLDVVERFHCQLREVSQGGPDLTAELITETQLADLTEDKLEEVFRLSPSKETWVPLKRAKLSAIAMEQEMIAAGDREYCG